MQDLLLFLFLLMTMDVRRLCTILVVGGVGNSRMAKP